jgi:hypothetical protein
MVARHTHPGIESGYGRGVRAARTRLRVVTEGFDTQDLKEAKVLLDELA